MPNPNRIELLNPFGFFLSIVFRNWFLEITALEWYQRRNAI